MINNYPADRTTTVAIIGYGKRDEILVKKAQGEGLDGSPTDFNSLNKPDGRHFKLTSYPIIPNSIEVVLKIRSRVSLADDATDILDSSFYWYDEENGYIVLKHPLGTGEQLRVKYIATFDTDNPRLFSSSDLEQVYTYYGAQSLTNTISVGATIAFQSGAPYVLTVLAASLTKGSFDPALFNNANEGDVSSAWDTAYEALSKEAAYYIVPLPPQDLNSKGFPKPDKPTEYSNYSTVVMEGLQFVDKMSQTQNYNEAVLIAGETGNLTQDRAKEAFGQSERVIFASPVTTNYFIDGQLQTLDGRYLAPALAGVLASMSLGAGALNKTISSIFVPSIFNKSSLDLKTLASNGVSYFLPLSGGAKLSRAITTSQSRNPVLEEPSVLRIKDYLIIDLRNRISKFVGTTIQVNTISEIQDFTLRFLKQQIDNKKIITKFDNIRVKQDLTEPRQINISFDIQPVFPLVWINISFNLLLL